MNIEISNPKELTMYWHALLAFKKAQTIADIMMDLDLHSREQRFTVLFGSLCGYYARQFGPNHGIGRLSDDIVPRPYQARHLELKTMRNKIFMHADSDAEMSDGCKVNELKFSASEDGTSLTVEHDYVIPKKETFGQVLDLLNILTVSINEKIKEYLNEMKFDQPFAPGTRYSLQINEGEVILEKK